MLTMNNVSSNELLTDSSGFLWDLANCYLPPLEVMFAGSPLLCQLTVLEFLLLVLSLCDCLGL